MSDKMKHPPHGDTQAARLLSLAAGREILPLSVIRAAGLPSNVASRLVREGKLERVGRGLYRHPDAPISAHHDLVEVMARMDKAVIVLLSALRFHELGTQQPHGVWIQLPARARVPKIEWPALRVVRTRSEALFTEGVERHFIGGIEIPVTSPARTVADCFKYRNQIGLDVCLEAAKELRRRDRGSSRDLYHYAKLNRVQRVVQLYLEASA